MDDELMTEARPEMGDGLSAAERSTANLAAADTSHQPSTYCLGTFPTVAEAAVATNKELQRRPTFAPFLKMGNELTALCVELGWLTPDDKALVRLWATFLDPRPRRRRLYRNEGGAIVAAGERSAIVCVGGELRVGMTRQGKRIFSFQRSPTGGEWSTGPMWRDPARVRGQRSRERHTARYPLLLRATELGASAVAAFIGDPAGVISLTGRYCGHCAICGKALADPLSLERGIGPDCWINADPHLGHGWLAKVSS